MVMTRLVRIIVSVVLLCGGVSVAIAQVSVPDKLSIIGFDGDSWNVYLSDQGELNKIDKIPDPRSFSHNAKNGTIAYVGSDAHLYLHQIDTGSTTQLSRSKDNLRYTQPFFSQSGKQLYIVQLPDGKSRRTEIVGISTEDQLKRFFVKKRTAQFEPYTRDDNHLYYSTAICVDDCEGMIWELWRRELTSAKQYQLTLLNHVSNQPHLSADNWLYFSSNAPDGHFHIWRMRPEVGATPEQLTFERARDSEPFTDNENNVYFIRKTRNTTSLMSIQEGKVMPVLTPEILVDFRNLEIR